MLQNIEFWKLLSRTHWSCERSSSEGYQREFLQEHQNQHDTIFELAFD